MRVQQSMVLKSGTNIRLSGIRIQNKRTQSVVKSSLTGVFSIGTVIGDTLEFSSDSYQTAHSIVHDFEDEIMYLEPATQLQVVVVKSTSIANDLAETQLAYRKQGVFYDGDPHYYYLVLKPFTFIYENFKSEVKHARRFKKYAHNELNSLEIAKRFNNITIKQAIPIADNELDEFKLEYEPTIEQIRKWNDYDLVFYIRKSYIEFKSQQ